MSSVFSAAEGLTDRDFSPNIGEKEARLHSLVNKAVSRHIDLNKVDIKSGGHSNMQDLFVGVYDRQTGDEIAYCCMVDSNQAVLQYFGAGKTYIPLH